MKRKEEFIESQVFSPVDYKQLKFTVAYPKGDEKAKNKKYIPMYLIDFDFSEELNFKSIDFELALINNNGEKYKTLKDSKSVESWFSSYGTDYGDS